MFGLESKRKIFIIEITVRKLFGNIKEEVILFIELYEDLI